RVHARSANRAAIINEPFELDHLRNEIEIDRDSVRTHHGFDFEGYAGVAGLEACRRRWRDWKGPAGRGAECNIRIVSAPKSLRDLRRLKLRRVTELSHDFDHRALPTLRRHPRRGEEIDSLLLIQG